MKKKEYIAPAILEEIQLEMEGQILAASHVDMKIEDDVEVVSMGQDVDNNGEWWDHAW